MDQIAVITQDDTLRKSLKQTLTQAGFSVVATTVSELTKDGYRGDRCAALIVDVAGVNANAADLIRRVRKEPKLEEVPLLMIISGEQAGLLEQGDIDDFMPAPVSPPVLEQRLKFLLRGLGRWTPQERLVLGALTMDFAKYEVTLHHEPLDLTYKEFELLKFLVTHPDRVYSREQLLNQVWGYDYLGGTRTVDVHVRRLRAKLGPRHSSLIETVRNVGYKCTPQAFSR